MGKHPIESMFATVRKCEENIKRHCGSRMTQRGVLVTLPDNARRSDVDRLRALRSGDYGRVEKRFLDRERFELDILLRNDR